MARRERSRARQAHLEVVVPGLRVRGTSRSAPALLHGPGDLHGQRCTGERRAQAGGGVDPLRPGPPAHRGALEKRLFHDGPSSPALGAATYLGNLARSTTGLRSDHHEYRLRNQDGISVSFGRKTSEAFSARNEGTGTSAQRLWPSAAAADVCTTIRGRARSPHTRSRCGDAVCRTQVRPTAARPCWAATHVSTKVASATTGSQSVRYSTHHIAAVVDVPLGSMNRRSMKQPQPRPG